MADTYNIENEEIFSTGVWHGIKYTEKDLNDILDSFGKDKVGFTPPLKLGHNDEQKLLVKDGLPAAGWAINLKKVGNKILADFRDVPKKIFELMNKKAYQQKSVEIYKKFKGQDGKIFPMVLKAVSLLGSDIPEVSSLNDMLSLYDSENREYVVIDFQKEDRSNLKHEPNKEGKKMVEKDDKKFTRTDDEVNKILAREKKLQDEVAKFKKDSENVNAQFDNFKSQFENVNSKLDEANKNLETTKTNLEKEVFKNRLKEIDLTVKDDVKNMKVTPAQEPAYRSLLIAFSDDNKETIYFDKNGKELKKTVSILFKEFIDNQMSHVFDAKTVEGNEISANDDEAKIVKYCKDKGLDVSNTEHYKQAYVAVATDLSKGGK